MTEVLNSLEPGAEDFGGGGAADEGAVSFQVCVGVWTHVWRSKRWWVRVVSKSKPWWLTHQLDPVLLWDTDACFNQLR